MERAGVRALAIDDHAAGEHQPSAEPRRGELLQQGGRPEVVVQGVVADVEHVLPDPNHRGLVAHALHAAQCSRHGARVGHIAFDPLGAGIHVGGGRPVSGGQQGVQYAHRLPALHERVDDVRADEPRPAGHKNHVRQGKAPTRPPDGSGRRISLRVTSCRVACER